MSLADPNPLACFVERLSGRSRLGGPERAALLALNGRASQIDANRDIVLEREKVRHATFVVSGLIASFGQMRSGQRQIVAIHLAGEMANLHSVVIPEASEALQALSATTIVQVPHAELRDLAECYPALAMAFWRESAVRNAIAAQWIVNIGGRSALPRIAHLYCELACREHGGRGKDGISFSFLATQMHLADMTGLTAVHVNRTLRQLSDQGLIRYGGRVVTIPDWNRLVEVAEFSSTYLQLSGTAPYSAPAAGREPTPPAPAIMRAAH